MSSTILFDLNTLKSLPDLENLFSKNDSMIQLRLPSRIRPARFLLLTQNGVRYFRFQPRESFSLLIAAAIELVRENNPEPTYAASNLCYVGNTGSGKSYNLAALVCLLRARKAKG